MRIPPFFTPSLVRASFHLKAEAEKATMMYRRNFPIVDHSSTPHTLARRMPRDMDMAVPKMGRKEKAASHEPFFST